MKIALDPYMHRHLSLEELPSKVAELGYEWIELTPARRFPLMVQGAARLSPSGSRAFKKALRDAQRWRSRRSCRCTAGQLERRDERQAAVRHWKQAIEIAVEMGVDTMNSEFGRGPRPDSGHPATAAAPAR